MCLSCGHRQDSATEPARVHHLLPIPWEPVDTINPRHVTAAYVEALDSDFTKQPA
jgi:hypothetical protein